MGYQDSISLCDLTARMENAQKEMRKAEQIKLDGAQASIELLRETQSQNEILKKQLSEFQATNSKLNLEFEMSVRESIKNRHIALWTLMVSMVGVLVACIALFVK